MKIIFIKLEAMRNTLNDFLKKIVRQIKVIHPLINEFKYELQFFFRQVFKISHEDHLYFLKKIKLSKPEQEYIFIDIGANRGQTIQSVRMLKKFKIISFEPISFLYKKIIKKYKCDYLNTFCFGLSNKESIEYIHTPFYNKVPFYGLSSLSREESLNFFKEDRFLFFNSRLLKVKRLQIKIKTLDSFNLDCDFLKADVQGNELNTIKGAIETIKKSQPFIILERPSKDLEVEFLKQFGYKPYIFEKGIFYRGFNSYNVIFMKEKHKKMFNKNLFQ